MEKMFEKGSYVMLRECKLVVKTSRRTKDDES